MVLIALIILICIITYICAYKADRTKKDRRGAVILALIISCVIILPIAIWAPLNGCEEMQCVQEIELIPLRGMEHEGTWYVYETASGYRKSGSYLCAYDNMEKYNLEGEAYEEYTIFKEGKEKVYESAECTKPVLKKFERRGKPSVFSFAVGYKETEIIFFVPSGTVLEEE